MSSLAPGTYRIINVKSGTALTVSDGGEGSIFCWQRHGGRVQQWLVQRSGDRYRFKNSGTSQYLTVPNPENATDVYGGKHPASWDLDRCEQDRDSYMIRFRDYDRVLDLDGWGAGYNGNHVHMSPHLEWMPHRSWKFERLSDVPGEEDQRLHKQIAERDQQLAEKDQQLINRERQLADMMKQLEARVEDNESDHQQPESRFTEGTTSLRRDGIRLSRRDSDGSVDLAQAKEELRRAKETIRDRDTTILTLQNELLNERMEHEMTRQAREITELREKMAGIESRLGKGGPAGQNAS